LPGRLKVAVVGDATARALRAWNVEPALQPTRADAEGLLAELAPRVSRRQRVLLPHAADARPDLADGLAAAGAEAVAVVAYDKRLPKDAWERVTELFGRAPLGWVTFTSPSIVRNFVEVLGEAWTQRKSELLAASIGPVTSKELRRQGVEPAAEAAVSSDAGLVAAVVGRRRLEIRD
jgi:uroporphyrinogen III methyltransferase/synthase